MLRPVWELLTLTDWHTVGLEMTVHTYMLNKKNTESHKGGLRAGGGPGPTYTVYTVYSVVVSVSL